MVSACASPTSPTTPPPDPYAEGPHITCPASPNAFTSPNGQAMSIQYGTATTTGGAPPVSVACTPANGSTFPIGTTAVSCTATDSRQRTDQCSFNVSVLAPPKISVTKFVAFGDSITWGENGISATASISSTIRPRFQVAKTYPTVLYQSLATRYTAQGILVSNQGNPGELASDSATRSRFGNAISGFETVLLMEGSNDLTEGLGTFAITALRNMVRDAKARGVKPFLATIPPMDGSSCCPRRGSAAPQVPGFNDQVRGVASSEGVPLVDIYNALNSSPSSYIGTDGLHPNDAGYQKIGETFFNSVKENLEVKSSTTTLAIPQSARPYSPALRRR